MSFSSNSFNRKLSALGIKPVLGQIKLEGFKSVRIHNAYADVAKNWCQAKFKDNWIWSSPFQNPYTTFYFQTSEDALLFRLTFKTA